MIRNRKKSENSKEIEDNKLQFSESLVSHRTPVLFATDEGLHLKTIKNWQGTQNESNYDVEFCDLERWVSYQAHTVRLSEDTNHHSSARNTSSKTRSVRFVIEKGGKFPSQ